MSRQHRGGFEEGKSSWSREARMNSIITHPGLVPKLSGKPSLAGVQFNAGFTALKHAFRTISASL